MGSIDYFDKIYVMGSKVDGNGALALAEVVVDALRNPHSERPHDESKLGRITQQ
jgi:hypothetical protein